MKHLLHVNPVLCQAKAIITEELHQAGRQIVRILLFGSRARGDAREDSDWDFYVVVDEELSDSQRLSLIHI